MTEREIMKDFDEDKHGERFCKKMKCHECDGTDFNGEPNGYGCYGRDEYISKRYNAILENRKRRITTASTKRQSSHRLK